MAVSSVVLFYKLNGIQVEQKVTVLGVNFSGVTEEGLSLSVGLLLLYLLCHFLVNSWDFLCCWRLLLSDPRAHGMSRDEMGTSNIKDFYLYNWWMHCVNGGNQQWEDSLKKLVLDKPEIAPELKHFATEVVPQITRGLEKFDKFFREFRIFQVSRLVIVEFLVPVFLGIWACYLCFVN